MKKTAIIYGQLENDLQKRALEELTKILLDYTFEYPICMRYDEPVDTTIFRCIYIGTKANHPYIKSNSQNKLDTAESYAIVVKDDTVMIEGYDDAGVLYGVLDFYNQYLIKFEHTAGHNDANEDWVALWEREELPSFAYTSAPSVKERGLWSWGHAIFDYREYLHNIMKLKMNSVIIWNDFVPTNAKEVVAYAHSCNIKVYWGFHWLWDTKEHTINLHNLDGESEKIFQKFETQYANAHGDGIYFQTFTEKLSESLDGVLIAEAAANFVNRTSALFYEKYPTLEIQFGLHATSVKNRLEFIQLVDSRIRIVWEDCGAFPFAYLPKELEGFDETKELVKKIAILRGNEDRFGVVTKGFVTLDWGLFQHLKGSQWIGVSSKGMRKQRANKRAQTWRYIQAGWLANADKAQEMVRQMYQLKNGDLSIFALVEDGLFEENIMYPVALYSEMLWNCNGDIKELMREVAQRSYVSFA